MKITVTNRELLQAQPTISTIMQAKRESVNDTGVSYSALYKISRVLPIIIEAIHDIHETRKELIKRHGEPAENSSEEYKIPEENREQLNAEYEEVLDTEIELDFMPIKPSVLDFVDGLSVQDLMSVGFLLEGGTIGGRAGQGGLGAMVASDAVLDRDLNAAINIETEALRITEAEVGSRTLKTRADGSVRPEVLAVPCETGKVAEKGQPSRPC